MPSATARLRPTLVAPRKLSYKDRRDQQAGAFGMEISPDSGSGSTARIALTGRLDIQGAETVALPLATLSGAKQNVVIDMSGVSFIASIGIRHLVSASKALTRRGG